MFKAVIFAVSIVVIKNLLLYCLVGPMDDDEEGKVLIYGTSTVVMLIFAIGVLLVLKNIFGISIV